METASGLPDEIEEAFRQEAEAKANSPVAKLLGLPMAGVNAVARWGARAQGLPVDDSATVGGMLKSAVAPTPTIAPASPQEAISQGVAKVAGPVIEEGTGIAMDPSLWLSGGAAEAGAIVPKGPLAAVKRTVAGVKAHPPLAPLDLVHQAAKTHGINIEAAEFRQATQALTGKPHLDALTPQQLDTIREHIQSDPGAFRAERRGLPRDPNFEPSIEDLKRIRNRQAPGSPGLAQAERDLTSAVGKPPPMPPAPGSAGLWEQLAAEAKGAKGAPPLSRWEQMAQEAKAAQGLNAKGQPMTPAQIQENLTKGLDSTGNPLPGSGAAFRRKLQADIDAHNAKYPVDEAAVAENRIRGMNSDQLRQEMLWQRGAPPPPAPGLMDQVAGMTSGDARAEIRKQMLKQRAPGGTDDILGIKQNIAGGPGKFDVREILQRVKAEAAAKNMQKPIMRQTLKSLSQELGTSLDAPHLGSGYFHDVHDIGATSSGQPVVMRVNSSSLKGQQGLEWPKSSHIIQPIKRQFIKGSNGEMDRIVEVVPKVPKAKLSEVEMDKLREGLLKDGYMLVDPEGTGGNVTRIQGKPTVVDPGAVVPTPLELEYQKYKNYEGSIPNTPSNAAEIAHAKNVVAQRTARVGIGLGAGALSKMFYDNSGGIAQPQPPPSQDLSKLGVPQI